MEYKIAKQELIKQAEVIFRSHLHHGYSKWKNTNYRYISPARTEYVFQWLWDTAFHAIVLSHFDTDWAKKEIANFLKAQRSDGFLPHIIFWGEKRLRHWAYIESVPSLRPRTTAITQPPVFALAVEALYKKDRDKKFLQEVLPKIAAHHKWLLRERDLDGDYLISIISPNESGMDELPVFQYVFGFLREDPARLHYYYRKADILNQLNRFNNRRILNQDYFNVEELLFNCLFIENCRALSRLFNEIKNGEEAAYFKDVAEKSEKSLLTKCWDAKDKIFYSLFSKQEKHAKVKTVASLLPLFLEGIKGEQLKSLVKHLTNPKEFWTNYPVPSVSKDEPFYRPTDTPFYKVKLLWRGPTWINTNWFIIKGLQKHGYKEIASEIIAKTLELVKKNGFREYYNPETGVGYRHHNFGWSTLVIDLL